MTIMLPTSVSASTTGSEAALFKAIRDSAESSGFYCMHSLGIARHQRKEYAEADFVVVGPPGVFCLEVKGGDVERRQGVWHIGRPGRSYTSNEGPFKQAQGAKWALLAYLKDRLGRSLRNETVVGWGVAFPDIIFDRKDPEWDADLVYDQRDKDKPFVVYIERLARYFRIRSEEIGRRPRAPLTAARVAEIVRMLRGDFEIVPTLRGLLIESERELVELSAEQYRVLDFALNRHNPRIVCDGAAGTGKTLIAMEAARRLAATGTSVLLLCFNNNLQRFLRADAADGGDRIQVSTVHGIITGLTRKGGFGQAMDGARRERRPARAFFDEELPRLFESACEALLEDGALPQYDVLILDEAQDVLDAATMDCLSLLLAGGFANGRWLIFHDSGLQSSIYDRVDREVLARLISFGATVCKLDENFRNPKAVVAEACLLTGADVPACRRSVVSPVDYRPYADMRDQAKKLRALVLDLLREGVEPGRISILSAVRNEESCIARHPLDVGKVTVPVADRALGRGDGAITYGTVSGFKGLESDVVVLTDLDEGPNDAWSRAVLYVGMTRARSKLFALVGGGFMETRSRM
ncbi:NERD domain-containing protein [uncultured Sphingomonas sp.]|uniref:nuclease-related domain-containing DEAD/DEAH box helicase n=1 Tax=uncultured Sphingomonas sp. TaxID=158754 RepID=UPI0035CB10AD